MSQRRLRRLHAFNFQGKQIADDMGAEGYLECSARTGDGIQGLFDQAIRAVLPPKTIVCKYRGTQLI